MQHNVNVALQILPWSATKETYDIVDQAIKVIHDSGIKYRVCPFETVMEGEYKVIMKIVENVLDTCLQYGSDNILSILKIQVSRNKNVTIEDKMVKYD
jgi:uncharacterized protein YqgV (UPF0045/DUF77 family)